jgi:colanic acid/amylovoran biosynthesis glycosyltransferase
MRDMVAAPSVMPTVAIFRASLFRPSEPFIHEQAQALTTFQPLFVGRTMETEPPPDLAVRLLTGRHGRWGATVRHALLLLCRAPNPYAPLLSDVPGLALVHAHFGPDAVLAMSLAQGRGLPLVTTFHGLDAVFSTATMLISGRPGLMSYALRRSLLMRRGSIFLCVSEFLRRKLLSLGFPSDRTFTHFIGVDCSFFSPTARVARPPNGGRTILHLARLVDVKGTRYLIAALSKVRERCPDARLVIIGDGPLRGELTSLARKLGLGPYVQFLGTQPRHVVRDWFRQADAFCLPSCPTAEGEEEGFGLSAVEAAACGVPVVVTRSGGLPETVQPDRTGFLVEPNSPDALAAALCTILENDQLRLEMAAHARRMAVSSFDLRKQTALLEKHYRFALKNTTSSSTAGILDEQ